MNKYANVNKPAQSPQAYRCMLICVINIRPLCTSNPSFQVKEHVTILQRGGDCNLESYVKFTRQSNKLNPLVNRAKMIKSVYVY